MDIKIRFIEASPELAAETLLLRPEQGLALKRKLLARLGIELQPGETPLKAWLRAMHEKNGLEPQLPAHEAITQAILTNPDASRFMYVLAGENA